MKNSSRFDETIARNLTRSSRGTSPSSANWRTRSLNCIHESSRLKYRLRSARSGTVISGALVTSATTPNDRTPDISRVNELLYACQVEQNSLAQAPARDLERFVQREARGLQGQQA